VKAQRALSDEQERRRIEGLRALARVIARRSLADSRTSDDFRLAMRPDGTQRERVHRGRGG